jgi:hypothetical protein
MLTSAQPHPMRDLARIDRHHLRRNRQRLLQQPAHHGLPSTPNKDARLPQEPRTRDLSATRGTRH